MDHKHTFKFRVNTFIVLQTTNMVTVRNFEVVNDEIEPSGNLYQWKLCLRVIYSLTIYKEISRGKQKHMFVLPITSWFWLYTQPLRTSTASQRIVKFYLAHIL